MESYDIIIIGAGPAGLTAGIYGGRQKTKTLIIDKGFAGGLGLEVPAMENYPGFESISGMELIKTMKLQAEKLCEIRENELIETIDKKENGFHIKTSNHNYLTKSIILATGASHKHLNVPGEDEFLGKGIAYCATCDGMFFINKDVLMVGGGNSAVQEAIYLKNIGCNVTLVHRRDTLRAQDYLQKLLKEKEIPIIWNSTIEEIKGNRMVESVVLLNNDGTKKEIAIDGVFIAIGDSPSNGLAKKLNVAIDESGYIITDKTQTTSVDYVYSAGDITGGVKQWVVACGEGAVAVTQAYKDLEKNGLL